MTATALAQRTAERTLTRSEFGMLRQSSRVDLRRTSPFEVTRDATDGEGDSGNGLTMEGDAAVFNQLTVIDSWEGKFKEQLVPGSWRKTLREVTPRVQFDHGSHPMIGSIPIGTLREAYETDTTVHTITDLLGNWLVEPVVDALANEAINGMSFRFSVVREEWRHPDGKLVKLEELEDLLFETWLRDVPEDELLTRSLKEVRVVELGPVVWPAYEGTTVGVRSGTITIDLGRLDRPEQRSNLARAIMLADLADRSTDKLQRSGAPSANGHPSDRPSESTDAPPEAGHPSDAKHDPFADQEQRMASVMSRLQERKA